MNPKYAKFFEPLMINKMLIKNRFAMSPMGTFTEERDGTFGARTIDYYEARAKGGAGLIISEVQYVTNKLDPWVAYITTADTDDQLKCWNELAEKVHAHGSKLCVQLGCGLGKNAFAFDGDGGDMVSASANESYWVPGKICRPMTIEEIHDTVASYGRAAARCLVAGVDAIEIHAHCGYILDQFMTPFWNKRTDEYGGSFENRMRFISEIYHAIRNVVGPNYPILVRLAADHDYEGGRTIEDTIEIVKYLEKLGIDAFDVDMGAYEKKQWVVPAPLLGYSSMAEGAVAIKKAVNVPVLNSGTHTLDTAIEYLNKGELDVIMMGRPLIADPDLPNKVFRGKEADIRPCLFCNECAGSMYKNLHVSCAVNVCAAAEREYPIKKTDNPKKIVVVGGGPAGMEAARVAALQGHNVTLYEKSDRLGGQLVPASAPPFKKRLHELSTWLQRQITNLGVEIVLNHAIDENSPELADAHKIIVALGAAPIIPKMDGVDKPHVVEITKAHDHPELVKGDTILVAGGGQSGCDAALEYAMQGKHSIIVEMKDRVAPEEWITDNIIPLTLKLAEYNVEQMLQTRIIRFTDNGALVELADGTQK